jgi:KUP system potassium uptake protein
LMVDLTFFATNTLKLISGAWFSLAMGSLASLVIATWVRGRSILSRKERGDRIPLGDLLASLERRPRHRVPGVAVYLSPEPDLTPMALMHNLKHNGVLHEVNVVVTVETAGVPRMSHLEPPRVERLAAGFIRVRLKFGYMERPDVPGSLGALASQGLRFDPLDTSYFLSRRTILATHVRGLGRLQDLLFIALTRNAANPSDYYNIPSGQVVEMGFQIAV